MQIQVYSYHKIVLEGAIFLLLLHVLFVVHVHVYLAFYCSNLQESSVSMINYGSGVGVKYNDKDREYTHVGWIRRVNYSIPANGPLCKHNYCTMWRHQIATNHRSWVLRARLSTWRRYISSRHHIQSPRVIEKGRVAVTKNVRTPLWICSCN